MRVSNNRTLVLGLGDEPLHEHASAGGQHVRRSGCLASDGGLLEPPRLVMLSEITEQARQAHLRRQRAHVVRAELRSE